MTRCDDLDGDGFGAGPDCACSGNALDCDDGDASTDATASVSCCNGGTRACVAGAWSLCTGATGETCDGVDNDCNGVADDLGEITCGTGACKKTVPACAAAALGVCVPGAPASDVDACNRVDDDCDGAVDEDCTDCFRVALEGDDDLAAADEGASPFRSVQAAIDFADTHRDISNRVCVAAGPACAATATYEGPTGADLTMREGISLLGNYESTSWSRCSDSTTTLAPQTARGVVFPPEIAVQTVLDGFAIHRAYDPVEVAGVTVDGARGVVLSNLTIVGGEEGPANTRVMERSRGVALSNGALAWVIGSRLDIQRSVTHFAVHAADSTVFVADNCPAAPDGVTGRCATACSDSGPQIRSEIMLENAAGSRVERNAICAPAGAGEPGQEARRGVTVRGRAFGIVLRANLVAIEGYRSFPPQAGLSLEECGGDAPWILDNERINAEIRAEFDALRATGDCHPVIEANAFIGNTVWRGDTASHGTAIACAGGSAPSRCVIFRNAEILGSSEGSSSLYACGQSVTGKGVACRDESCGRIEENGINGLTTRIICSAGCCLRGGTGVTFAGGAPLVVKNTIAAGSGTSMTGFASFNRAPSSGVTNGRFAHNLHTDGYDGSFAEFEANRVSNVRWWGGGVVRGNCISEFREGGSAADPSVFENNTLASYIDEGVTSLTPAQVNALTDMITAGNDAWPCVRPVGP